MNEYTVTNTKALANDLISFIEERFKLRGTNNGILTGIDAVDAATEGIKPGQVITIADEPACSMSLFSQFIETISVNQKITGLVYTTRTSIRKMGVFLLSIISKVSFRKLISGLCKKEDLNAIQEKLSSFYEASLYFQYNPITNWKILENDISYHANSNDVKIVFLENLTSLMNNENDEVELFILLTKLKEFAKNNEIIILSNYTPKEEQPNRKILTVLELESDVFFHLTERRVLENNRFREYKFKAINESLCLHNESFLYFDVMERKFLRKTRLDQISQKDIDSFEGLERIRYLLNNLFSCYTLWETCMDDEQKVDIADLYHRVLTELKQIPDIKASLKSCNSLDELKTEIELYLETFQKMHSKTESFNLSEEEIKEVEIILNTYQNAIYEEIANKMADDEILKYLL